MVPKKVSFPLPWGESSLDVLPELGSVEWDRAYALTNGILFLPDDSEFLVVEFFNHNGIPCGWLAISTDEITSIAELDESSPEVAYFLSNPTGPQPLGKIQGRWAELLSNLAQLELLTTIYTKTGGTETKTTGLVGSVNGEGVELTTTSGTGDDSILFEISNLQAVEWEIVDNSDASWAKDLDMQTISWDRGHESLVMAPLGPVDVDGFSWWCRFEQDARFDGLAWILDHEIVSRERSEVLPRGSSAPPSDVLTQHSMLRSLLISSADSGFLLEFRFVATGAQELLVGRVRSLIGDEVVLELISPTGKQETDCLTVSVADIISVVRDSGYLRMLEHSRP